MTSMDNAEFIAHARSDIPYLLDRLAASEQEAARLRAALGRADGFMHVVSANILESLPDDVRQAINDLARIRRAEIQEALGATTATEAERAGPIPEGQI
jgi:hypothetical protein